jgi:hypothetical protein
MVAAKRKSDKDPAPQPMLDLGWDESSDTSEETKEEAEETTRVDEPEPELASGMKSAEFIIPDEDPDDEVPEFEEGVEFAEFTIPDEEPDDDVSLSIQDDEVASDLPAAETVLPEDSEPELEPGMDALPEDDSDDSQWVAGPTDEPEAVPEPEAEPEPARPPAPVRESLADEMPADPEDRSVGGRLRNARLAAGLSVARVAEETCLHSGFITALETGQFDKMLPLAFSRSYVRRLCELYCLPEQGIVQDFVAAYEAQQGSHRKQTVFHVAADGEDGASKVAYVPTGMTVGGDDGRSVTVGGIVAGLMVLIAVALSVTTVATLIVRHSRGNANAIESPVGPAETGESKTQGTAPKVETTPGEGEPGTPAALPPIDVRQFILPEELPLDELEIPK